MLECSGDHGWRIKHYYKKIIVGWRVLKWVMD
jgi:hypothetical protein